MHTSSRGRARIGVLVPFTNTNLEADLVMLRPDGVSLHFARLGGYDADEVPDEKQMAGLGEAPLDEPLHLLMGVRPDIVLYGCTSATLSHGPGFDKDLAARVNAMTGAATVTAAGALVHAIRALGVTRVGFASPYVASLNDRAIAFLAGSGIETVSRADVDGTLGNYGQGEMTPDDVFALGQRADSETAEAIVLSCTDMRSVEMIGRLETATGKPVITSNQALMHAAFAKLGIAPGAFAPGQLFAQSSAQPEMTAA
ncbi:MAG: maleate cis-trans isomerase family protein [Hyphomicrobiaceae bacterium]